MASWDCHSEVGQCALGRRGRRGWERHNAKRWAEVPGQREHRWVGSFAGANTRDAPLSLATQCKEYLSRDHANVSLTVRMSKLSSGARNPRIKAKTLRREKRDMGAQTEAAGHKNSKTGSAPDMGTHMYTRARKRPGMLSAAVQS